MKKLLFFPLLLLALLASCDLETSDNGDLDGYWQLARVDTLATGGTRDMTSTRLYWSVQMNLLQVSDINYVLDSYLFRFEHKGNSLRLYDPYQVDRTNGDKAVSEKSVLYPYGIHSLDETFTIESLDGKEMRLKSDSLRLSFNKY